MSHSYVLHFLWTLFTLLFCAHFTAREGNDSLLRSRHFFIAKCVYETNDNYLWTRQNVFENIFHRSSRNGHDACSIYRAIRVTVPNFKSSNFYKQRFRTYQHNVALLHVREEFDRRSIITVCDEKPYLFNAADDSQIRAKLEDIYGYLIVSVGSDMHGNATSGLRHLKVKLNPKGCPNTTHGKKVQMFSVCAPLSTGCPPPNPQLKSMYNCIVNHHV